MNNRLFFSFLIGLFFFSLLAKPVVCSETEKNSEKSHVNIITLFLSGDVMTGRGIDQLMPHPSNPQLHEPYVKSAQGYVQLAEKIHGVIQKPISYSYIWGDALKELERIKPDVRIINLETSVTKSNGYWKSKSIHYRMHPENIPCLTSVKIDFCSLANNHTLDWGYPGLIETLETLKRANIKNAGAGRNLREAESPAVIEVEGKGRVLVFSYGAGTSGISHSWAATGEKPGVNLLKDFSEKTVARVKKKVQTFRKQRDIVIGSIHWGSNWGYDILPRQRVFAHELIDKAGFDVIHGHSSHHVKGIEVYHDKLILYGCGDFLNDYEGISGYEAYRGDLGLMYFADVNPSTGKLIHLQMIPTQIKRFQVKRASRADTVWLRDTLNREGKKFGNQVKINEDGTLILQWH